MRRPGHHKCDGKLLKVHALKDDCEMTGADFEASAVGPANCRSRLHVSRLLTALFEARLFLDFLYHRREVHAVGRRAPHSEEFQRHQDLRE